MNNWNKSLAVYESCGAAMAALLFCLIGTPLVGQVSAPTDPATTTEDKTDTYNLPKLEVVSTQDTGYVTTHAATAFKTNEKLMMIPQAVTVVTRDLITDSGYAQSSDVLQFAGVSNFFRGESFALRGARLGYALIDEMDDLNNYADNINIDSYEVIRGPAQVLYPFAGLGGTILKTTRKPSSFSATSVSATFDTYGKYRAEFDTMGSVAKLGPGAINFRAEGAYQDGDTFLKNAQDSVRAIHPSIEYRDASTRILVAVDYQDIHSVPFGSNAVTPTGALYTGAGRDEGYMAKGAGEEEFRYTGVRIEFNHSFSPNWENKTYAQYGRRHINGSYMYDAGLNWANMTESFGASHETINYEAYDYLSDFSGSYQIFGLPARSTFGVSLEHRNNRDVNLATDAVSSWADRPINNPRLDQITIPPESSYYVVPGNPGDLTRQLNFNGYFQETIEVVPDRLSLVGGLSWKSLDTTTIANTATLPTATATDNTLSKRLYRAGAVFQIMKDQLSVYAMQSTTASPQGTQKDANGQLLPAPVGTGKEVGLKADLFESRLVATLAVYDISLTSSAVFTGYSGTGQAIYANNGFTKQTGWDLDLAFKILPNWQAIGTVYDGKVRNQTGIPIANTYTGSWSIYTRYDAPSKSPFKGLSVGAGAVRISGRRVGAGGVVFAPGTAPANNQIVLEPGTLINLFARYQFNSHWSTSVGINNLLDKAYAVGAQAATFIDPSPPRTGSITIGYKF